MDSFSFTPVAFVRTPYAATADVPKGCGAAHVAEGVIEVLPELEPGLADIEGFSHLFVIWVFDRLPGVRGGGALRRGPGGTGDGFIQAAEPDGVELFGVAPTDDRPHGVFATRSPKRPNPIGLTVVELLRREGTALHVRGVDMLDGTPVLDIKPYLTSVDPQKLRRGWLAEAEARRQA